VRAAHAEETAAAGYDVARQPVDFDGTLQLLPGRLEALNGNGDKEIRFIRTPGVDAFTFGRSSGPEYTHFQLNAPSVSRMHGYMVFEEGHWRIGNLSRTNCVIVNGSPVDDEVGRALKDGDRIEFGEVAFLFWRK
jgi:pSer/pThr/pTyr-binding forkhead associated (FHA) protein